MAYYKTSIVPVTYNNPSYPVINVGKDKYRGRECGACQKRSLCTKAKVRELLIDIREPLLQKMREKLISDEGRRKYFMRQYIIEPVFGHLKFNVGYRNFLLRGLEKVCAEFKLMCIGWNLKKMLKLKIRPATV